MLSGCCQHRMKYLYSSPLASQASQLVGSLTHSLRHMPYSAPVFVQWEKTCERKKRGKGLRRRLRRHFVTYWGLASFRWSDRWVSKGHSNWFQCKYTSFRHFPGSSSPASLKKKQSNKFRIETAVMLSDTLSAGWHCKHLCVVLRVASSFQANSCPSLT